MSRLFKTTRPALETLESRTVPSTVAANYDSGVWRWDSADGWNHITTSQASQLDVDDAGNVFGKFGDGVWRWSDATWTWQKLSSLNVSTFQATAGGALYGDFGANGTWRWASNTGWQLLSGFDVVVYAASDSDALFGRFDAGVVGTWRWTAATGWQLLSNNRPDRIQADDAGNMVGVFNTLIGAGQQGTWRWNTAAGWGWLSTAVPNAIEVSDNGVVFEARGGAGVWRYDPSQPGLGFVQISNVAVNNSTLFALPNGSLYYDFHTPGTGTAYAGWNYNGWYYNGSTGAWSLVVENSSTAFPVAVGKDGDLFFDRGSLGMYRWSLATGLYQLGLSNPLLMASQS